MSKRAVQGRLLESQAYLTETEEVFTLVLSLPGVSAMDHHAERSAGQAAKVRII
jgi:hypothetical protein